MVKCQFCGKETHYPFKCNYCGGRYCEDHRLPTEHECDGLTTWRLKAPPKGVIWEISPYGDSFRDSTAEEGTGGHILVGGVEEFIPYIPDRILPSAEPDEPLPGWEELGLSRRVLDYLYELPRKKYCYHCGKKLESNDLVFICRTCDLSFCEEHRLPEIHNCLGKRKYALPPGIGYDELLAMGGLDETVASRCEFCGMGLKTIPFKCDYCDGLFCEEHRLPPNHDCTNIGLWKEKISIAPVSSRGWRTSAKTSFERESKVKKTKKRSSIKYLAAFLILILSIAYFNQEIYSFVTSMKEGLPVTPPTPDKIVPKNIEEKIQKIAEIPSREKILNETIHSVLEELNKERQKHGLPPVKLMQTGIAQFRASDMINRSYYSHYDPDGYPPFYYYTKMGGLFAIEENLGMTSIYGGSFSSSEVSENAVEHVYGMIYDDASSQWGHRDSLLDPSNNYVDIGVDWSSDRIVLVIHMIKKHVEWINPPKVNKMIFSASGKLDSDVKFYGVGVFYHPPPDKIKNPTSRVSYDIGDQIAGVIPAPYYYQEIKTWRPSRWLVDGNKFDISFKISPINGRGFYTVVIFAENKSGYKHPYDSKRSGKWIILEYTVFVDK